MSSDKNKDGTICRILEAGTGLVSEEVQNTDATDDFDPFSGPVECYEETLDIALSAPPESQSVMPLI